MVAVEIQKDMVRSGFDQFIGDVAACLAEDEVIERFVEFLTERGFTLAIIKSIELDQGAINLDIFSNFPERQLALCADLQKAGEHPVMMHVEHTMLPFFVRDLPPEYRRSDLQKQYWAAFVDDLDNTIVLPLYISERLRGIVMAAGSDADTSTETIHEIHAAVFYVVGKWLRLRQSTYGQFADNVSCLRLSKREHECLVLAARGLSEKHIARTLRISPNTVRVHAANANRKLGANSKTHAIAIAMMQGQIDFTDLL